MLAFLITFSAFGYDFQETLTCHGVNLKTSNLFTKQIHLKYPKNLFHKIKARIDQKDYLETTPGTFVFQTNIENQTLKKYDSISFKKDLNSAMISAVKTFQGKVISKEVLAVLFDCL